ncbi:MAG: hypothetical protein IJM37_09440 [Lachnospiraceae bacterium]|nr:hypothetical protein [Lachnospiraceae bacterium]
MLEEKAAFIKKAESLKPKLYIKRVRPLLGIPTDKLKAGDSTVFDFGNHFVGRIKLKLSSAGSHQDAPAFIKIKFCENKRELDEDAADYHGWISKGWIQEEWLHIDVLPAVVNVDRRFSFRYVKLEVIDVSSKFSLVVDDIEAETYTSANDECVNKYSGSREEEDLDRVSIRTLRNCMQEVFEDGPKRDRRLWIGDLRLQALANYATFKNNDLVKRCLYLFAGTTDDNGRITACVFTEPNVEGDDTYMFDYSLFFIPTLLDYYNETKDLETVSDLFDTAKRQVELAKECFGPDDIINDSDVMGWCFLDWNLRLNKQAGAQAVYIYCEKALVKLAKYLGKSELAAELCNDVENKVKAAKEKLYDKDLGLFVSGREKQVSYATQAWAVLAGIFDDEVNHEILNRLHEYKNAEKMVTPYMYHHYIEALIKSGNKKLAYDKMCSYWGAMIEKGADTYYELFNPENPYESPYGSSVVNSYCHAWSCTPAYFIRSCGLNKENLYNQLI